MKIIVVFLLLTTSMFAQNIKISGKITDEKTLNPLDNVLVYSVSFQKSTYSDKTGYFELNLPKTETVTLRFLLAGYSPLYMDVSVNNSGSVTADILMTPVAIHLGEVTVTSPRYVSSLQESPYPLGIIEKSEIDNNSKLSLAEFLKEEPGVALTRDGVWATDISVRGIRGTGIVLMVDGNRLETATELSARMSMIDQFDIERVEIIKGAASSMYGTGALGGIVNVITQNRKFRDNFYYTGSIGGFFNSVNKGSGTSLSFNTGANNWFAKIRGSFRGASATETPDGVISNSHYHDNSLSASFGFKPLLNHEFELNYQRYGGDDIGLPGGSAFPAAAIARYPTAKREMYSAEYKFSEISSILSNVSVKYWHQLIVRDAEVVLPTARLLPYADHVSDGIQAVSNWLFNSNYRFVLGVDAWQREMDSRRQRITQNRTKDTTTITGERPVPISKFRSGGIFFQNEIDNIAQNLNIAIGGRFDLINIKSERSYNPEYVSVNGVVNNNPPSKKILWEAKDENNFSWSLNIASLYKITREQQVSFNFGKSFRSPSLEERFQFLDLGGLVKLGNPALDPEEGWFYDLGYRFYSSGAMFKANFYLNTLTNLVVEQPGYTFQGRPATQMVNFGAAKIFGFDLAFELKLLKEVILYGNASAVRGEDSKKTEDLPFIPADNATIGLRIKAVEFADASVELTGVADQNKIAAAEKRTPGYGLVNLNISSKPFKLPYGEIRLTVGVDNLLDRSYFNHLATNRGLIKGEPGRNLFIKANITF
ncbi:MAG: TonB-dependent receptor [Ignavibacteria bacterium]|nr:TonB-dependent receptor [Ignavibacteria bacterium]